MSETPTPEITKEVSKEVSKKRRGLSLPPRGQALSRLQDLEADLPASKDEDAVNTASSTPAHSDASVQARSKRERAASGEAREATTRITVDMPDNLHRRMSLLSAEERRSLKDLVIDALEKTYFGQEGGGR